MQWMSLQWMSLESMSLQWMSLQWMSLQWMSLQWMSLQWMSLERMSLQWMPLQWMSLQWMSLQWMSLERASPQWTDCRCNGCHCNWQLLVFDWILPTETSFSHRQLTLFERSLARKASLLRPQFPVFVEASHESFALHLQLFRFLKESLTRKLPFHIVNFHFLREVSHEYVLRNGGARNAALCSTKCASENGRGRSAARRLRDGLGCAGSCSDHSRLGWAMQLPLQASFWKLEVVSFWRKSRTKASFSHLQPLGFGWSLARKLRFHIVNFQFLIEVSHESFVFTSSIFSFWLKSRTKASFSHRQLSVFDWSLSRKLRFHIFNFQFLRAFSHKSFVFASSTSKASFSHQYTAPFEGSFARKLRFYISSISLFYGSLARKLRFHELKLQGCGNELSLFLLVFGAFHFPLHFLLKSLRETVPFFALAPRSCFGAGFGPEKRWDYLRVSCEELRWGEKGWEDVRRASKMWEEERRDEKT